MIHLNNEKGNSSYPAINKEKRLLKIDNFLITLPRFGSFPSRGMVLCVATKGGTQYDKNAEGSILWKPYSL